MRCSWLIAALVAVSAWTCAVADEHPALQMSGQDADDVSAVMWQPTASSNPDGTVAYRGVFQADHWRCEYDITVKEDPWINAGLVVTNITPTTQTYTFITTLPIAPPLPGATLHGGSMQGGLTDNTVNGVLGTVTTDPVTGSPLYYGMIDGVGVLPLYAHPYSVSAPWDGGSATIPAVSAGLPPPPTIPSGPANLTIGIKHTFTLTAGDTATFSSFFMVIPEPVSLVLLALGALMLRRR